MLKERKIIRGKKSPVHQLKISLSLSYFYDFLCFKGTSQARHYYNIPLGPSKAKTCSFGPVVVFEVRLAIFVPPYEMRSLSTYSVVLVLAFFPLSLSLFSWRSNQNIWEDNVTYLPSSQPISCPGGLESSQLELRTTSCLEEAAAKRKPKIRTCFVWTRLLLDFCWPSIYIYNWN